MAYSSLFLDYRSGLRRRYPRIRPARVSLLVVPQLVLFVCVALFPALSAAAQSPAAPSPARELHIAAAADLQPVMPALAAAYERATGVRIVASFGSTATLTQQILSGDPQDVFLSADFLHPEQVVAAKLADGREPTPYARGVLVLWARRDSPAQPLSLDSLRKPAVTRIALANPAHAPYGLAASRAIAALGLTDTLRPKLVVAENVGQAAQFAASGNAQAAFISLTLANSEPLRASGSFLRLPPTFYPAIQQCGTVLKNARQLDGARQFLQWLTSTNVQATLPSLGLDPAR